jgi:Tfp pilus assembly ATPase PilU
MYAPNPATEVFTFLNLAISASGIGRLRVNVFMQRGETCMLTLKQYGLLKVMEGLTDQVSVHAACA